MKPFDAAFLGVLTLAALGLWFEGYQAAAADQEPDPLGMRTAILAPARATDPLGMSLPAGLRVDPSTGLLMGISLPEIPGVEGLRWELLRTYAYRPGLEGMPDSIRKLDGKRVVMIGFLMTLFEFDDIRDFHLVANHWSCCYGAPAGLDGALRVKLATGQEGLPNTIKPLRVIGTLRVAEVKEAGSDIVWAIYSLDDAEVTLLDF